MSNPLPEQKNTWRPGPICERTRINRVTSRNWFPSEESGNGDVFGSRPPLAESVSASCSPSANIWLAASRMGLPPSISTMALTACRRASAAALGQKFMPDRPRLAPGGTTLLRTSAPSRKMAGDDTETADSESVAPKRSSRRPPQPVCCVADPVCACVV